MKSRPRFSSLVLAAATSWAACAALMAISPVIDDGSTLPRSIATTFPTAAAGVALHAVDAR